MIFGLPGVQLYHALEGLEGEPGIRFITTRHEQGTTYMADGYARTGGEVGTSLVVPGPGVLNASAGLCDAYAASSPVFLVSGQINIAGIGQNKGILHEIDDQLDVVRTITKWCSRVLDPKEIPGAVHEAFHQMKTGRPRPVEIEIPPETLAQMADIELQEPGVYGPMAPDSAETGAGRCPYRQEPEGGHLGWWGGCLVPRLGGADPLGGAPAGAGNHHPRRQGGDRRASLPLLGHMPGWREPR